MGKKALIGVGIGIAGGFFGGLAGLGGGVVMIPLMTVFAGLSQHEAHGSSLFAIAFTGAIGAITYFVHGSVDWLAALILAASGIFFTRLGAVYAHTLSERGLKKGFGVFLICVSLLLISKGWLSGAGGELSLFPKVLVLLLAGVGTGFISGMMGVGGGSVMIPAMVIVAGMPQHLAQGTSLLAMVPVGISGAFTHYRLGNVQTRLAFGLAIGVIGGGFLGATVANLLPDIYLRLIFALIGIWMGVAYARTA
jgi:uncharacterized membrane protein YfcA